jgi:hypothetical protein
VRRLAVLALLLLAGCAGGPPAPPPFQGPPAPVQVPIPPPPEPVPTFLADIPNLSVAAWCEQGTPVECNPDMPADAVWGSFNRPGDQGLGCVGRGPNECWAIEDGAYVTRDVIPGFPIITRATFPKDQHLIARATMAAVLSEEDTGGWGGLVFPYDGEEDWEGIYFNYAGPGLVNLAVWTPGAIEKIAGPFPADSWHDVEIELNAGVFTFRVDGVVRPVTAALHAPRFNAPVAVFSGNEVLKVKDLRVYVLPP